MPLPYQTVLAAFDRRFTGLPDVLIRAPGRVNLIGEHTDYNDGFVLPMAINRNVWLAVRQRTDRQVIAHSLTFNDSISFCLDDPSRKKDSWEDYVQGVAWVLEKQGRVLPGWEGVVGSDVPVGSGLSSSAALELAVARAFVALAGGRWDPVEMARVAQQAENEWVGMNCGIMDQLISAAGQRGRGLFIDCRSLKYTPVNLPEDAGIVVMDTGTRRELVDSAYNERRMQCEAAARHFDVPALRDVEWARFNAEAHRLDEVIRKRARHVITENARTRAAAEAMRTSDPDRLGRLMNESHDSLRDDFEVTNDALNAMVEVAREDSRCWGARMTGGGFGGCAVALVRRQSLEEFIGRIAPAYAARTGLSSTCYVTEAEDGAAVEKQLLLN